MGLHEDYLGGNVSKRWEGFLEIRDAGDWLGRAHSREAKEIKDRPAVLVIYEPK